MSNKFDEINNIFNRENIILTPEELEDITKQIERKPLLLYITAIEYLKQNKIKINYHNISNVIKLDIRIRNILRQLVTSLEECIRVNYFESKFDMLNKDDWDKVSRMNLKQIIEKNFDKKDEKEIHNIRIMRNDLSHLIYPILDNKIDSYLCVLRDIKGNYNWIAEETINSKISEIELQIKNIIYK